MSDKHIVAVTAIIIKGGKYLITRRNLQKKAFPGKWTVPGGRLEVNDYINEKKDTSEHWYNVLERVIRREVKEETGLDIKDINYLTSMTFMRGEEPALIISLYADYNEGEVVLNEESIDYKWVLLEEARQYDLIEGIYEELEMLDKKLKGEGIGGWEKRQILIIKDSVYGDEEINEPILIDLMNSKPVQRLKKIAQYGVPDDYYHKKNYSRYDHSVGVMILLRRLGASLEEQISGLLHDVSHTVFSHVVDWAIGDSTKEDYQDNNHLRIIENSEISSILDRYDLDYKKLSDIKSFTLLEREIPSLCADRIDYALRELKDDGFEIEELVFGLMDKDGQIVFKDEKVAEKFAKEFLRMQNEHWGGKQARMRYYLLGSALRIALDKGIINMDDLYKTDEEVINKLLDSADKEILNSLDFLRDDLKIVETSDGSGILLKKKFRYVDPEILIGEESKKLSEVSKDFQSVLDRERENSKMERRYVYKKIQNA